jgi:hypothetical protein
VGTRELFLSDHLRPHPTAPQDFVMKSVAEELKSRGRPVLEAPTSAYSKPTVLPWRLDATALQTIELASANIRLLIRKFELRVLTFPHFGRLFCKRIKITPDFFMQVGLLVCHSLCSLVIIWALFRVTHLRVWSQMAIQLAHWRVHGEAVATYETAHTRLFYHGRTETSMCPLASGPGSN